MVKLNRCGAGLPPCRRASARRAEIRCSALASLLLLCLSSPATAQNPEPHEFKIRAKQTTISAEEIVRGFEAPALTDYTLGRGDEITIGVWNHPELSGHHIIGPDGKITLPVAGVISLVDLSREDAQRAIADAFSKFYSSLSVTVQVDKYTSFRIFVLGRVGAPGALQFEAQPTLLDVITRAASLPIGGIGADKTGLIRCAIIRGRDRIVWVDLKVLLNQGNLAMNIRLARNDIVYIPDAGDQLVYVLGEVQHPGAFRLTPDMSFLDAFSQAGGMTEDASQNQIEVVRPTSGGEREITLKELLAAPRSVNYALEDGDIIYVRKRNLAKFGYLLQKASSLAAFAVVGSVATK
jgi:polysaccharide export outer membrane protein